MTPLERALRERIEAEGPITVEAYMEACNAYYYATRDPLGAAGDFTTAPEISQMFGEMVGAALADCWTRAGAPADAIYVELGPGRGTLASDALRVMRGGGFRRRSAFHRDEPGAARDPAAIAPGRARGTTRIESLPQGGRCCWSPTNFSMRCRCANSSAAIERRCRDRRRRASRSTATARSSRIRRFATKRRGRSARKLDDRGGVALVIDYGHAKQRAGRDAPGGARASLRAAAAQARASRI